MKKNIEEKYKVLNHIDHILLRPQTYLGSNKPNTSIKWVYDGSKMVKEEITHVPSFLKIFDEILTNCVDEHKRNPNLNEIRVLVDQNDGKITIRDNGGIPVVIHQEQNKWLPTVIFGTLMSGSNYDDSDDRTGSGVNGYGAKLTNVFSKKFEISTCDGKNQFRQIFTNNMRDQDEAKIKKSRINYTEISYLPDYEKFGMEKLDDSHFKMIMKRTMDVAGCNPKIKVYFNQNEIKCDSFQDYIKLYDEEIYFEYDKDTNWSIGVGKSQEGFQQISFVNTTDTYDGGSHVDFILNQIIIQLREFFLKKHKVDVKPSELKNHIFLFINSTIINPSFSSQTKEKLITEVKDFGYSPTITDKMLKWILKSEIVNSVLDWIQQKKNAEENKLARELNKNLSKIKVDKLIDAKGKERWKCSLSIFEGDSASNAFRKYRDPQTQGAFSLRGKFINATELTTQKLTENKEVVNLMGALGLKLGQKMVPGTLRYGRILFFCDADYDGSSIVGLLINFLHKYWPELFENKMVFKAETPIVVTRHGKTKKKISHYSQVDYNNWLGSINPKEWDIEYKKGLAALVDDEYSEIINNPRLTWISMDDQSKESLNIWFGKESEPRKIEMLK